MMLLVAFRVSGQVSTPLIPLEEQVWHYNDTGTDLGTAWRATSYPNESLWRSGNCLFGVESSVPYPYPVPIRTPLVLGAGRTTYYFRTHFSFSGNRSNISVFATGYIDDGAVFYLNGVEAGRVRMPSGPVTYDTRGQLAVPEGVPAMVEFSTMNLVQGDNVLAVEVHQASDTSSDVVFGLSLDAIGSELPAITDPSEPADRTVPEGGATTLSVFATGFPPPTYQWFRNNVPIPGATDSSLTLVNVSAIDTGSYFVRITNSSGSLTSRTALVTVQLDTNAPTILYALGQAAPTEVLIVFSEPVDPNEAEDGFNWKMHVAGGGLGLTVLGGMLLDGTNLVLSTAEPRDPTSAYVLETQGPIHDSFDNALPQGTEIPVALFEIGPPLIPLDATKLWRYNQSGMDLGTNWVRPGYEDSAWLVGAAPFDAFYSPGTAVACRNPLPITGGEVRTCLTLSNAANTAEIPTIYFRTHFTFAGDVAYSVLHVDSLLDDGAVYYLNGVELLRLGMPDGKITYNTLASRDAGDALQDTLYVSGSSLVVGDNVLAVELHQSSLTSPDLTFSVVLTSVLPSLPAQNPRLTISLAGGTVQITWLPASGTLESADDLTSSWTPIPPGSTPGQYTGPASDVMKFFRVALP